MLVLVGAGLDKKDISVKALECLKKADKVMMESYTAFISDDYVKWLEEATGKEITRCDRHDLEENAKVTLKDAKEKNIAIIIPGDPLIATTHHLLLSIAKSRNIEARIFHATSVFSAAIGESGLDIYRFGPTTTLPFWSEHYSPTSFLDVIASNARNNQHTMLLLDIDQSSGAPMELEYAIKLLVDAEEKRHLGVIRPDLAIIIMGDLGKNTQTTSYTLLSNIKKTKERFKGLALTLIIPQNPNFAEVENLSLLNNATPL